MYAMTDEVIISQNLTKVYKTLIKDPGLKGSVKALFKKQRDRKIARDIGGHFHRFFLYINFYGTYFSFFRPDFDYKIQFSDLQYLTNSHLKNYPTTTHLLC